MARTFVERDWAALLRDTGVGFAVAAGVFALAYANGGFDDTVKAYAGITAWWVLGIGAAIGLGAARARVGRYALWALGLLAAYAVWTLISMQWTPDNERAFAQFDQVSLYVVVLALAIVAARLVPATAIVGGVGLALSAIAGVSLVSRLFPSTFGVEPSTILPSLNNRLSFPLGYWNGLGIEVALAYPLLLSIMVSRRSRLASALAALPLPILAADMYLTSSRGAFTAAGVAVVAYLALTPNRWKALAATAVAGAAGVVAVAVLSPRHELVDGLTNTPLGNSQAHHSALVIGIACVGAAVVWGGLVELGRRVPTPPRMAGWAVTGLAIVLAIAAVAVSHPIAKFDSFKSNSFVSGGSGNATYVQTHLLSSSGSGRWQFWSAAMSEFRSSPVVGGGAGSWEAWWLQHGTLPGFFTQYAHSLYLESLAELGVIGLLLIAGAVLVAVVGAVRSALVLRSGEIAAAAAVGVAFFAAAAYDWVWQLAGIAVVGVGMLGVALGALPSTRVVGAWNRFGVVRPLVALVCVAAIVPQVVVLVAELHLRNSQQALAAGNATRARAQALAAQSIEPWAASPYLQLALIDQGVRKYAAARTEIQGALDRSHRDWRIWLTAAHIDTLAGRIEAATREYREAQRLNPNASVFQVSGT